MLEFFKNVLAVIGLMGVVGVGIIIFLCYISPEIKFDWSDLDD